MPPTLSFPDVALLLAYYLCLALLSCLGVHRAWLLWEARRLPPPPPPAPQPEQWPHLLVQLPVYNEPLVAERLIRACANLGYPSQLLTIQILDDSTDETPVVVEKTIHSLRQESSPVALQHLRRTDRTGFKAGALAAGLEQNNAPIIAMFDADFVPPEDFLQRTVPELLARPNTAFVQARWAYLNRREGVLQSAQAALLDGHFWREHYIRSTHGLIFNFNGTAGLWRREAIDAAGGWTGDTLTEDFDLSYRAQLAGWHAHFLPHIAVPSELPATWNALMSQQARWARGSLQCARKLLRPLWRSRLPLATKLEGTVPLLANLAWPLVALLMILALPAFRLRQELGLYGLFWLDLFYLFPATIAFYTFYATLPAEPGVRRLRRMKDALLALLLGIALSLNNGRAALLGLFGPTGTFQRTPKRGNAAKTQTTPKPAFRPSNIAIPALQLALTLYLLVLIALIVWIEVWPALPFTALFATGIAWGAAGMLRSTT